MGVVSVSYSTQTMTYAQAVTSCNQSVGVELMVNYDTHNIKNGEFWDGGAIESRRNRLIYAIGEVQRCEMQIATCQAWILLRSLLLQVGVCCLLHC